MQFILISSPLSLIIVFFPLFLQIFPSFLEKILILGQIFEEVLEFRKQRLKRDIKKLRIFRINIYTPMFWYATREQLEKDWRHSGEKQERSFRNVVFMIRL